MLFSLKHGPDDELLRAITIVKQAGYRIVKLERQAGDAYYDGAGVARVQRHFSIVAEI